MCGGGGREKGKICCTNVCVFVGERKGKDAHSEEGSWRKRNQAKSVLSVLYLVIVGVWDQGSGCNRTVKLHMSRSVA